MGGRIKELHNKPAPAALSHFTNPHDQPTSRDRADDADPDSADGNRRADCAGAGGCVVRPLTATDWARSVSIWWYSV
jgi:hypothetical protein